MTERDVLSRKEAIEVGLLSIPTFVILPSMRRLCALFSSEYQEADIEKLAQRAEDIVSILDNYQNIMPQYSFEAQKELPLSTFVTAALRNENKHPELLSDKRFLDRLRYLEVYYNQFPGEAYQCYGVASLMSALYFEKNKKLLGGNQPIREVKNIILRSDFGSKGKGWYPTRGEFVALKLGGEAPYAIYSISDIQPGDFFMEYKQDSVGHIGFVSRIKIVNGKLLIDTIDGNLTQKLNEEGKIETVRDGQIRYRKELTIPQFKALYSPHIVMEESIAILAAHQRDKRFMNLS